jgi:DNA-binding MarR family transcriptional regulator
MDYEINDSRMGKFWAPCPYWIGDTFQLDFVEQHIYNLILRQSVMIWTLNYIAALFGISLSTLRRMLEDMEKKEIITKMVLKNGCKRKCIIVANYTEKGKRTSEEIKKAAREGYIRMTTWQKKKQKEDIAEDLSNIEVEDYL